MLMPSVDGYKRKGMDVTDSTLCGSVSPQCKAAAYGRDNLISTVFQIALFSYSRVVFSPPQVFSLDLTSSVDRPDPIRCGQRSHNRFDG